MSNSGDKTNPSNNPFAVSTTDKGKASEPIFGSTSNSGHNPFPVNTNGNASTSASGNMTNSAHNPFAVNTTSNASMPICNSGHNPFPFDTHSTASPSAFGTMTNSAHNPFAVNTTGNASNNSAFASNTNGNASLSAFGNMTNATHNPFAVTLTPNASVSAFGNPSNSAPNPFAVNENGNASTSGFGNPSNPRPNSFAFNTNGNASMSVFGNQTNPPSTPVFRNPNNSTCNPFAGNTTSPSFDGTSTGAFGGQPSSVLTSPLTFGVPAAPKETSGSPAAFTNNMRNKAFGWGPGGSAPSSFSQSSGLKFGQPSNALFGTKGLMTSTSAGTNTSASNDRPFSFGSTESCSNPPFSFGVTQSTGLNKGSEIKPYAAINNAENNFLGTSSLQSQFNIVSTGSSFSPISQFPTSTPVVSSDIRPTTLNPFSPTPIAANPLNLIPPCPIAAYPLNLIPSTSFPTLTPSSTTAPSLIQTSTESLSLNRTQPSTSNPWSFTQPSTLTETGKSQINVSGSTSTDNPWLFTQPSTLTETGKSQINVSGSTSTDNPWPFTQPSTLTETEKSQINVSGSTSTDKAVDCIIAVKDPFGPQSVSSHPLTDHRICSPLIQNGISCMPVIDKPATTRISSLVTSRHISQRPLSVRARKYNPKSDGPKVPFFDHTDEIPSTQKESTFIIPRENPRSVFEATPKPSAVSCAKADVTDASTSLHDGRLKSKTDEASSSTPCNLEYQKSVDQKWQQVNPSASLPKLHRPDYYTQPSIQELRSAESNDPGFCSHVQNFVVGRHGYGEVKFEGETDVRGLDLDALVNFNKREVIVYEDEHEKPEIGEGLNKSAEVTLLNVKCSDKTGKEYESGKMVDKFLEKLKKVAEDQGAEFVSYDAVNGVWKFQVQHF